MNSINWWLFFYGLLFAIGILLAYTAFGQLQKTHSLLKNGIKTTATIKEFVVTRGENNNMYAPVFEYTDRRQDLKRYTSKVKSYPAPYDIGEKVKIVYDKSDSSKMKVISFWGLYNGSVILGMIAGPFLVIGGAYLAYQLF